MKSAKPKKHKKKSFVRVILNYTLTAALCLLAILIILAAFIIPHITIND